MARPKLIPYWLTPGWWRYVLWGLSGYGPWEQYEKPRFVTGCRHALCRWRGHPCGPVWQNIGGVEPDMHCRECGDDLG